MTVDSKLAFQSPGIDCKKSIPPGWESIPGLFKRFTNSGSDHCFIFTFMPYVPDVFAIVIFIGIVCEFVFRSVASKLFKLLLYNLRKCSFHSITIPEIRFFAHFKGYYQNHDML